MVVSHEVARYSEALQFSWSNGLEQGPIALKMSQNINKSMAYITNESGSDFLLGGCLCKPTSSTQWTSEHSWMSDMPQKQASEKAD